MSAVRLARGFTGRPKIVKFAGCYHGHVDALLAEAGSGVATLGLPDIARRHRRPGGRHDRPALQRPRRGRAPRSPQPGDRSPAVITEAAAGNMGAVAPDPGFNAGAALDHRRARRAARHRRGDDRVPGQPVGLVRPRAVAADLNTFGKVMSGGLPAAAFGGRAEVMGHLAPAGPVYQAGTLSGNPVAVAGGPGNAAGRRRGRLREPRRERETPRHAVG